MRNDLIQGALIGFGLAFVSAQIYARIKATKVNGWITMFGLGEPRSGAQQARRFFRLLFFKATDDNRSRHQALPLLSPIFRRTSRLSPANVVVAG